MVAFSDAQIMSFPRRMEMKVDSDPANLAAARKAVESFATACELDDKAAGEVGLCVNETLANIIRHAYSGRTDQPMHLVAEGTENELVITIRDWGNGVDPSSVPRAPYDPLTPGGVGLICIRELMDEVTYTPQADGMLTTMTKIKRENVTRET